MSAFFSHWDPWKYAKYLQMWLSFRDGRFYNDSLKDSMMTYAIFWFVKRIQYSVSSKNQVKKNHGPKRLTEGSNHKLNTVLLVWWSDGYHTRLPHSLVHAVRSRPQSNTQQCTIFTAIKGGGSHFFQVHWPGSPLSLFTLFRIICSSTAM